MTTNAQLIAAARGWIGTPFMHQGRHRDMGVDCLGLLICVSAECGIETGWHDRSDYGYRPDSAVMAHTLGQLLDRVPAQNIDAGDVLHIAFANDPIHLALVTDRDGPYILHAYSVVGRVVEHRLDTRWARRVTGIYRLRGIG